MIVRNDCYLYHSVLISIMKLIKFKNELIRWMLLFWLVNLSSNVGLHIFPSILIEIRLKIVGTADLSDWNYIIKILPSFWGFWIYFCIKKINLNNTKWWFHSNLFPLFFLKIFKIFDIYKTPKNIYFFKIINKI